MHVYRIDKFVVPAEAKDEFVGRVRMTHAVLKSQPGFIQDLVLEQSAGPGQFNFVTLAEWESQEAIENAKVAVMAMHKETQFNAQEMFARLGIKADLGNYRKIDAQPAF